MLLRVRGQGASPENSQATLMHLRGFRLTNTPPPSGTFLSHNGTRPLLFPHFHVGIEAPLPPTETAAETELDWQLRRVLWKEIWNMYDIAYDEMRLFPDVAATTTAMPCGDISLSGGSNFATLTARTGQKSAVVVTHYFAERGARAVLRSPTPLGDGDSTSTFIVLDVSAIPLVEASTRVAVEIAWIAAFASLQGAFASAKRVIVRLPYQYDHTDGTEPAAFLQEGLDFIGEHISLLSRDFAPAAGESAEIGIIGCEPAALQCSLAAGGACPVVLYRGDHRPAGDAEKLQAMASELRVGVRVETVPLRALLEGGEEPWDEATRRENQILNFCPCCGHCGH